MFMCVFDHQAQDQDRARTDNRAVTAPKSGTGHGPRPDQDLWDPGQDQDRHQTQDQDRVQDRDRGWYRDWERDWIQDRARDQRRRI